MEVDSDAAAPRDNATPRSGHVLHLVAEIRSSSWTTIRVARPLQAVGLRLRPAAGGFSVNDTVQDSKVARDALPYFAVFRVKPWSVRGVCMPKASLLSAAFDVTANTGLWSVLMARLVMFLCTYLGDTYVPINVCTYAKYNQLSLLSSSFTLRWHYLTHSLSVSSERSPPATHLCMHSHDMYRYLVISYQQTSPTGHVG